MSFYWHPPSYRKNLGTLCDSCFSKTIEFIILFISSLIFICSILHFSFIKLSHLETISTIFLSILLIFSAIITLSSICIIIFRYNGSINNKNNSISKFLSIACLIMSILICIISIIAEIFIQSTFTDINYPCIDISEPENNDVNEIIDYLNNLRNYSEFMNYTETINNSDSKFIRLLSSEILTDEEKKEFCKDKDRGYNTKKCSKLEKKLSLANAIIIPIITIYLICFLKNDYKRISLKVDGHIPEKKPDDIFQEGDKQADSNARNLKRNKSLYSNMITDKNKKKKIRKKRTSTSKQIKSINIINIKDSSDNFKNYEKNNKNKKKIEINKRSIENQTISIYKSKEDNRRKMNFK